jgi:hypothetical protein
VPEAVAETEYYLDRIQAELGAGRAAIELVVDIGFAPCKAEEMAEAERREKQIQTGQVQALPDAEFWRAIEADLN